jgi:hypothetical protein
MRELSGVSGPFRRLFARKGAGLRGAPGANPWNLIRIMPAEGAERSGSPEEAARLRAIPLRAFDFRPPHILPVPGARADGPVRLLRRWGPFIAGELGDHAHAEEYS